MNECTYKTSPTSFLKKETKRCDLQCSMQHLFYNNIEKHLRQAVEIAD